MHTISLTFWILWIAVVLVRVITAYYGHEAVLDEESPNLLGNPDFESDIQTSGDSFEWYVTGALTITYQKLTDNCISGNSCMMVADRDDLWKGLKSRVAPSTLSPGSKYWFSMFMRFIQDNGTLFTSKVIMKTRSLNGEETNDRIYEKVDLRADNKWLYFGVEITTLDNTDHVDFYEFYADLDPGMGYVVDATSLRKITTTNFVKEATDNIDKYRKGVINLRTIIPACYDSSQIKIELEQTKGAFGIGTNAEAEIFNNGKAEPVQGYNMAYSKYFQTYFNWVQFPSSTTWRNVEGLKKGSMDFDEIDKAMNWLRAYKLNVRGHFLHSNNEVDQPDWVKSISNTTAFTEELERRVDYMTDHFTGHLQMSHWDVSHKHSLSNYLQKKSDNPDILVDLAERTKERDANATLFFDSSIAEPVQIEKYVNFAIDILNKTESFGGIAASAAFTNSEIALRTDIGFIKKRLDVLSTFGLPIWVTDLEIPIMPDRDIFLTDLLMLLFGTPSVEGIMLKDMTDLVYPYTGGDTFSNNKLGQAWDAVMNTLFKTKETVRPTSGGEEVHSVKGFFGSYRMIVKHLDHVASTTYFELTKDREPDILVTFDCPGSF